MNYVAYLVLRRLRTPLITIITIYSISVLGYVLIPGKDALGNAYSMNFFEAFYFVSYMGSTIGFGELPFEFTAQQRFWTLFCIYATVVGWIYSIGSVISILRDPTFSSLIRRARFRHRVNSMKEPFYLVCGYGLTGTAVVADLAGRGIQCVVIDIQQACIDALELSSLPFDVPSMCSDASDPLILQDAGISHPLCRGTLCLTDDDHVNLYIALASKLLAPKRMVLSRVASREYAGNLKSFDTDHVIDPFETFSEYLTNAVVSPYRQLVYNWLISPKHRALQSVVKPEKGRWIICGFGRLGKAIQKRFERQGLETVIVEPDPEGANVKDDYRVVKGLGTEAPTLLEAGIQNAVGIVAGTADDANNLSIVLTAKAMRPQLMLVARQNKHPNGPIFAAADIHMIMDPNIIIAERIIALIKTPLLIHFLESLAKQDEDWCEKLVRHFDIMVKEKPLECWSINIDRTDAPAVYDALRYEHPITVANLTVHPQHREHQLRAMVLMIIRDGQPMLLPEDNQLLRIGDKVLFCGLARAEPKMMWIVCNENVLRYVLGENEQSGGYLWKRLFRSR